jgi:hypothetical protein
MASLLRQSGEMTGDESRSDRRGQAGPSHEHNEQLLDVYTQAQELINKTVRSLLFLQFLFTETHKNIGAANARAHVWCSNATDGRYAANQQCWCEFEQRS